MAIFFFENRAFYEIMR